jgi:hypothetical protein
VAVASASASSATSPYKGFTRLNPAECVPADAALLSKLPPVWGKYGSFVKICNLKKNGKESVIYIISIWEREYFKSIQQTGMTPELQSFPLPVIVNKSLSKIGDLPEVYPLDDITSQVIYYGKWRQSIPTEIRVDVKNPAEGGDYYYEPITYNWATGSYEMKNKETVNGRRR